MHLTDLISQGPVANVGARVCRKTDPNCNEPMTADLSSDASGIVTAQVPNGFDGYVEITPAGAMPGSYFFYPPITSNTDIPYVPIVSTSALGMFAQLVGTQIDPNRGEVFLGAYNCLHAPADGVRLSSADGDSETLPFYLVKGLPSTTATATDSSGLGGILNLRPGSVTLTGTLSTGQIVGTVSMFTRAGEITYTSVVPAPE
jgi:hypothetical protein